MFVVPTEVVREDQVVLARPLYHSQSHSMCMFNAHYMLASIKIAEVDGHIFLTLFELIWTTTALPSSVQRSMGMHSDLRILGIEDLSSSLLSRL
eukprot:2222783-Amphidinium_carterae.1